MKKILISICALFIVVIGINQLVQSKKEYYRFLADTIVGFYRDSSYDEKKIKKQDKDALITYLSKLTHKDEIIDLSEYIVKEKAYYVTSHNTSGVYKKDGKCYIEYEDLDFDKPVEEINYEMEPYKKVVCDNYFTVLYKSMFYPEYKVTKKDPKYDYVYNSEKKIENGYEFVYYSTYDGSGLKLNLMFEGNKLSEINTEFLSMGDY